MNWKKNSNLRWMLVLQYVGIMSILLACSALGGSAALEDGSLQLENGVIKYRGQNGNMQVLATRSSFELTGTLDSTEPWKVAARPLQVNDSTQIAGDVQVGDMVFVRGVLLEDGTWLAYSIEPATGQMNQQTIIVGEASSVEPWVVSGTELDVTEDTLIEGEIEPGTLVRVEAVPLEDGTWDVISMAPVNDIAATANCSTVIATIDSINGEEIRFLGWPTPVTVEGAEQNSAGIDLTDLQPGQQLLAEVCVTEDNRVVVRQITFLDAETDGDNNDDNNDSGEQSDDGEKVLVCHKPDKKGGHTISISSSAVSAHMGHGDKMGACP